MQLQFFRARDTETTKKTFFSFSTRLILISNKFNYGEKKKLIQLRICKLYCSDNRIFLR